MPKRLKTARLWSVVAAAVLLVVAILALGIPPAAAADAVRSLSAAI